MTVVNTYQHLARTVNANDLTHEQPALPFNQQDTYLPPPDFTSISSTFRLLARHEITHTGITIVERLGILIATGISGSAIGSCIGTFLLPGVGTVIGSFVGSAVFSGIGEWNSRTLDRSFRELALGSDNINRFAGWDQCRINKYCSWYATENNSSSRTRSWCAGV